MKSIHSRIYSLAKFIECSRFEENPSNVDYPHFFDSIHELESIYLLLRGAVGNYLPTDPDPIQSVHEKVWLEHDYCITQDEETTTIILPPLLPEHNRLPGKGRKYLAHAIRNAWAKKVLSFPLHRYEDCVVIFSHERVEDKRFDYDNLEYKVFVDAIADLFLTGDHALNINVYHMYRKQNANRTVVTILPKNRFPAWISANTLL